MRFIYLLLPCLINLCFVNRCSLRYFRSSIMLLSKLLSRLRRKSRVIPTTLQSNSEPTLKSCLTSSPILERPASALDVGFSHSYHCNFGQSNQRTIRKVEVVEPEPVINRELDNMARGERCPESDKDSLQSNLDFSAKNTLDYPSPTQRPCSAPCDVNGYRVSRFFEHLHLDDAYEALARQSRFAPEEAIRFRNTMNASNQTVPLATPTGVERKDSRHKRNHSFPIYPTKRAKAPPTPPSNKGNDI